MNQALHGRLVQANVLKWLTTGSPWLTSADSHNGQVFYRLVLWALIRSFAFYKFTTGGADARVKDLERSTSRKSAFLSFLRSARAVRCSRTYARQ